MTIMSAMHGYDLWEFPPENERRKRTGEFCLPEHRKKAWSSYQLTPLSHPSPGEKNIPSTCRSKQTQRSTKRKPQNVSRSGQDRANSRRLTQITRIVNIQTWKFQRVRPDRVCAGAPAPGRRQSPYSLASVAETNQNKKKQRRLINPP